MNDFPAPPTVQGQQASQGAYRQLLALEERPSWWQDYLAIRDKFPHFKNWRIWVYVAWAGQPVRGRKPATKEELAAEILRCSSRVIRKWEARNYGDLPGVLEAIAWVQAWPLLRHRRDIYNALIGVAVQIDPKAHQDRKLALELLGDYRPNGGGQENREQAQMENWLNELREAA